jgi:hypothetical protein
MKKLLSVALLLGLTSCGGYENLNTPFNYRGKGVNLFGSEAEPAAGGQTGAFEVVVNGPAGTSEAVAMNLFEQEAKRVCGGREYTKQITSQGTASIREYGVKGVNTNTFDTQAPTVRGYVQCQS